MIFAWNLTNRGPWRLEQGGRQCSLARMRGEVGLAAASFVELSKGLWKEPQRVSSVLGAAGLIFVLSVGRQHCAWAHTHSNRRGAAKRHPADSVVPALARGQLSPLSGLTVLISKNRTKIGISTNPRYRQ